MQFTKNLYIFNSRITTHVLFWVVYYILFSLIWVTNEGYLASFYLEFILLPIRIMTVYVTIYLLLPTFLIKNNYLKFILWYVILLFVAAMLQRIFIHFFYENLLLNNQYEKLFSLRMLIRAFILINTTVFFILSIKIFQLFVNEREKNEKSMINFIEIKADRRIHRVLLNEILFIKGEGNYTTYHLLSNSKLTAYGSIKKAIESLPKNFIRVHKSYIVNKNEIKSFDTNTIEIQNELIPRGKSVSDDVFLT